MIFNKLINFVINIFRKILFPISLIYYLIVLIRNKLFDLSIIKSKNFDIPIITIGNITVGGTGKTPHVEYLVEYFLNQNKNVGIISRGYKRKTKGFRIVDVKSSSSESGDEPLQIKLKYPRSIVCVCEKRYQGIQKMLKYFPELQIIIMDDGFQHRYVKPSLSILLIDFNRPVFKDCILPTGNLREPINAIKRSDCIIITKCLENIKQENLINFINKLKVDNASIFYSYIEYSNPINIIHDTNFDNNKINKNTNVIALTGIANPSTFIYHLKKHFNIIKHLEYNDHHNYTINDLKNIYKELKIVNKETYVITTEKDIVKLRELIDKNHELTNYLYYIKIRVRILPLFHNVSFEEYLKNRLLF